MTNHFVTSANLLHDDLPWCHVEWMSNPELVGSEHLLLVRATFQPGEVHKFHTHPGREEIIYVLAGSAEQWVGHDKRVLGPGEVAHIPKNTPHATRNAGTQPLIFLAILSPVEAAGEFSVDLSGEEPWRGLLP